MATTRKTASTRKSAGANKTASTRKPAGTSKTASARKSTPTRKTTASRKAAEESQERETTRAGTPKKLPAMKVAQAAAEQLTMLTGREPECVIGIERTDDGWTVDLEVVESRRIPDSTDVLAIYEVDVDDDGDLIGYHRARRYIRGKGGDGEGSSR